MPLDAIVTLLVVCGLVVVLARGWTSPAAGVMGAAVVLLLCGVLTPDEAFAGFSDPAVVTIAGLYVVADAVQRTGLLDRAVERMLASGRGDRSTLLRLLAPTAAVSSLLNNTPVVAAAAPVVYANAVRSRRPASRFLMPLSYATILGGVVTTIGTSTNLVVAGLVQQRGLPSFGLFATTPIGLPLALLGVLLLVVTAPRLLPDRVTPGRAQATEDGHAVGFLVRPGSELDGARLSASGLRRLPGGFVAAVERDGRLEVASGRGALRGGDVLTVVGDAAQLSALTDHPALLATERHHLPPTVGDELQLVEAVLGAGSPLVGATLAAAGFRERYAAAVLSVQRDGRPVAGRLGRVPLRAGDALLVLCDPGFVDRWHGRDDFALLAVPPRTTGPSVPRTARAPSLRAWWVLVVAFAMVVLAATGVVSILQASLAATLVLVAMGATNVAQARAAVDLDVLVVVAGSFALGAAMEASGLAERVADLAAAGAAVGGRLGGVLIVVVATMLLTEPLSNATAAALMLPVALEVAGQLGGDPLVFAAGVAIAASASFLTPIGYQTNTMVYGLGGYRFGDYARLGAPLTLLSLVVVSTGLLLLAW